MLSLRRRSGRHAQGIAAGPSKGHLYGRDVREAHEYTSGHIPGAINH